VSSAKAWLKAIELTASIEKLPGRLIADVVEDWAKRQPGRAALISDIETFDYAALDKRINRYARWARSRGLRKGDTVALLMTNRPDYVACWLGISRVGVAVALINPKLVGQSLAHCIDVAAPSQVIVSE
jgi:fatty-acyl-CoA synthase